MYSKIVIIKQGLGFLKRFL